MPMVFLYSVCARALLTILEERAGGQLECIDLNSAVSRLAVNCYRRAFKVAG